MIEGINHTVHQVQIEKGECVERNDEQGDRRCSVIFIGCRYEVLFLVIKEKPQGHWCGDEGTKRALRKTRCPDKQGCEDVF